MNDWKETHRKRKAGLAMAREAVMIHDAQQTLANDRKRTSQTQTKLLDLPVEGEDVDDDQGIHIGDIIHQPPAQPQARPSRKNSLPPWLPYALLATGILGGGGLGFGAAVALLVERAKPVIEQEIQQAQPAEIDDQDTHYQMTFGD